MTLRVATPRELGLDAGRWAAACELARALVERDVLPAVACQLIRPDAVSDAVVYGRLQVAGRPTAAPLPADTLFLTASLSKPIVAMAALRLVEQGRLSLQDRVVDWVPEFDAPPKRPTTVRHLLTHTSGLPDMLPNNRALRQSQAGLERFVSGACGVTLDFPPGRGVQYQSLGFAVLGEIITRAAGQSCADFIHEELFQPLGMTDSVLGAPDDWFTGPASREQRIAEVRVPEEQRDGPEWNWNSRYWRQLGAPWGGVLSTAGDLSRFVQLMLKRGASAAGRLFAPATVAAATTNQLHAWHDIPDADRRTRGWGYGWRLNWTGHAATFGDLLGPDVYGHWGATGTLWWIDPLREVGCVLLSTQPLERDRTDLLRLSNAFAAALL